ncbi:MAG: hypothetical protein JXB88_16460 [Spirochaetales bacterium]|nr:hypothetical protein [Spirochaetales bacterium]
MKKKKIFYCAGIIWEIVRFLLFFILITFIYFKPFTGETDTLPWLLFLSSCQLLMPAGYVLLFFNSTKFHVVIQLLRIGKILSLFPSFFIFFNEFFIRNTLFSVPFTPLSLYKKGTIVILLISIFFDLIFLYFLLSYKGTGKEVVEMRGESSHLPDYRITEVKSDFFSETSDE